MADLIDRQAAIETAIEAADKWDGGYSSEREGIIRKFFDKVPAVQPDHTAGISKKVEGDCISRQVAIDALARMMPRSYTPDGSHPADEEIFRAQEIFADCIEALEILPSAQPDRAIIDDCLHHIYKNISVHTATGGVITIKHYMQVLYEEIYGKGKRPWWMT